jgi:quinol monooxygenase YgiN
MLPIPRLRSRVAASNRVRAALVSAAITTSVAGALLLWDTDFAIGSERSTETSRQLFLAEAILHAKPGKEGVLLKQLQDIQRGTRAEPGNLVYDIHQSVDDPLLFVVLEAFVDRAAFDRHRQEPPTVAFSERGAFETLTKPEFDRIFMTAIGNTVVDDPDHEGTAMPSFRAAQRIR